MAQGKVALKGGNSNKWRKWNPEENFSEQRWLVAADGRSFVGPVRVMVVERRANEDVVMIRSNAGKQLRIGPQGAVTDNGGFGPWVKLLSSPSGAIETENGLLFLRSLAFDAGGNPLYLHASREESILDVTKTCGLENKWMIKTQAPTGGAALKIGASSSPPPTVDVQTPLRQHQQQQIQKKQQRQQSPVAVGLLSRAFTNSAFDAYRKEGWYEAMQLNHEQLDAFVRDGYIVIPGIVPQDLVQDARREVNSRAMEWGMPESGDKSNNPGKNLNGDERWRSVAQRLVLESPALAIAEHLLGRDRIPAHSLRGPQLAMRLPQPADGSSLHGQHNRVISDDDATPLKNTNKWHVDGLGEGKLTPFSILLGVALTKQKGPSSGNLIVFPGSHRIVGAALATIFHSGAAADGGDKGTNEASWGRWKRPSLQHIKPVAVAMDPGDIVLCHQKLAHRAGPNGSSDIRLQAYYRITTHEDGDRMSKHQAELDDIWTEFQGPGVREAVQAFNGVRTFSVDRDGDEGMDEMEFIVL